MEWRCSVCGQSYDEPPEACDCGAMSLEPVPGSAEDAKTRDAAAAIRGRLFDPVEADRNPGHDETYVTTVFRFLLLVALLGAVMLLVLAFI